MILQTQDPKKKQPKRLEVSTEMAMGRNDPGTAAVAVAALLGAMKLRDGSSNLRERGCRGGDEIFLT